MESIYTVTGKKQWWEDRYGYQIYPRTFCDSNGDGIGDLKGIISKVDYFKQLGINTIWISPFYPSPGIDCGYDVSNFCEIDPEIGTLEEFDELLKVFHENDIAVLLDIVPNHSSNEHELFKKALADPNSPERDMYLFRDPKPDGSPPNNWLSVFGGPAWKLDEPSGQYYLHLFYEEQPDFNWRNENVQIMFEDILRFWFERGVDGFRVDVTQGLFKHQDLPDAKILFDLPVDSPGEKQFESRDSSHYYCLGETARLFERWREIADEYGAVLIGEMIETTPERLERYFTGNGIHLVFFLTSARISWEPSQLVAMFDKCRKQFPNQIAWMASNHDYSRVVSRFGGGKLGIIRALALTAFMSLYRGFPFIYNGEELGLGDCDVSIENVRDPRAIRFANSQDEGRDKCRTNMPWHSEQKNQGFTNAQKAWLVSPPRDMKDCADVQMQDQDSPFNRYREVIALHQQYPMLVTSDEEKRWVNEPNFIGYFSGEYFVGFNPGPVSIEIDSDQHFDLLYCTNKEFNSLSGLVVPGESTVMYRVANA